jgi:hypothetical protein
MNAVFCFAASSLPWEVGAADAEKNTRQKRYRRIPFNAAKIAGHNKYEGRIFYSRSLAHHLLKKRKSRLNKIGVRIRSVQYNKGVNISEDLRYINPK